MILYLDTSALVKLFVQEQHSDQVQAAAATARMVATHVIAYPEARAGFAKAHRMGRIDQQALSQLEASLDEVWPSFDIVGVDEALARRAGLLAAQYGLRGYDAVHLAAAETLHLSAGPGRLRFACFDKALSIAAETIGLQKHTPA